MTDILYDTEVMRRVCLCRGLWSHPNDPKVTFSLAWGDVVCCSCSRPLAQDAVYECSNCEEICLPDKFPTDSKGRRYLSVVYRLRIEHDFMKKIFFMKTTADVARAIAQYEPYICESCREVNE